MATVIVLTILAGLLGGIGNLFIGTPAQATDDRPIVSFWWQILSCLTLGVIAAALVPLFLSMAKSDLVSQASGASQTSGIDRFVYFGFCLLAAVTSRQFIDTLASRALRLIGDAQQKINQIDRNLEEVNAIHEEPERSSGDLKAAAAALSPKNKVLAALVSHSQFSRRTTAGISTDANLPEPEVESHLKTLSVEGLVERKPSTDGRQLWVATKRGRAHLN